MLSVFVKLVKLIVLIGSIYKMNLEKINLNLLVALDALLTERQVTRAAHKVNISQSAMSIALAQLRELLQDEVLVRGANGMIPTRRAWNYSPKSTGCWRVLRV